jgi:beta-carotene ketolase (CrtW type)
MQTFTRQPKILEIDDWIGLSVAIVILSLWLSSLILSLGIQLASTPLVWIIVAVLGRTFLHTGLFILTHDAIHGNLIPHHKLLNNLMGKIAVRLYAFLPYKRCCLNHWKHHRYPNQTGDPDFHGGIDHPLFWYLKFLREYLPFHSLVIFMILWGIIFWSFSQIFHVSLANLMLFWVLPFILSSVQLFLFGTYLPHREINGQSNYSHRLENNKWLVFWSFLTCYHFGNYHWEHHQYPKTPWYSLPTLHLSRRGALK